MKTKKIWLNFSDDEPENNVNFFVETTKTNKQIQNKVDEIIEELEEEEGNYWSYDNVLAELIKAKFVKDLGNKNDGSYYIYA